MQRQPVRPSVRAAKRADGYKKFPKKVGPIWRPFQESEWVAANVRWGNGCRKYSGLPGFPATATGIIMLKASLTVSFYSAARRDA
jgi:hypothetical protein